MDAAACDEAIPHVAPDVAVRQIFAVHAPFLWRILRRLGVRTADIEDVCQEVLIVVYRKLSDFQGHGSIRTWLYTICIRTASDYRRKAHFRREFPTDAVPDSSVPARQEQYVERREALDWLDSILDRMEDEKRAVFVLYEIEELPMSEIATIVGCPVQTAYSRLHAARKQVEAAIKQQEVAMATAHVLALRSSR